MTLGIAGGSAFLLPLAACVAGAPVEVAAPSRSAGEVRALRGAAIDLCETLSRTLGPFPGEKIRILVSGEGRPTRGVRGSARGASLVIAPARGAALREIEEVLAHELVHLFAAAEFAPEARYAREGLAEHFARVAMRDARGASEGESLRALARSLEVWISTAHRTGWSLAEASPLFHEDAGAREMSYAGGHVLAFLLDDALSDSGGLAAVARGLRGDPSVSSADLRDAIVRRGGAPAGDLFDRLVDGPADLSLVDVFPATLRVTSRQALDGWLGLRFVPGAVPAVLEVSPRSPASRAGVLPGDTVESFDGVEVRTVADVLQARGREASFRLEVRRGEERVSLSGSFETVTRFRIRRKAR